MRMEEATIDQAAGSFAGAAVFVISDVVVEPSISD
jgi:hypothetical protein